MAAPHTGGGGVSVLAILAEALGLVPPPLDLLSAEEPLTDEDEDGGYSPLGNTGGGIPEDSSQPQNTGGGITEKDSSQPQNTGGGLLEGAPVAAGSSQPLGNAGRGISERDSSQPQNTGGGLLEGAPVNGLRWRLLDSALFQNGFVAFRRPLLGDWASLHT